MVEWNQGLSVSLLPQPKDMLVGTDADSNVAVGLDVNVNGCLPFCVSPVINLRPIQSVPCPSPSDRRDRLNPPVKSED